MYWKTKNNLIFIKLVISIFNFLNLSTRIVVYSVISVPRILRNQFWSSSVILQWVFLPLYICIYRKLHRTLKFKNLRLWKHLHWCLSVENIKNLCEKMLTEKFHTRTLEKVTMVTLTIKLFIEHALRTFTVI